MLRLFKWWEVATHLTAMKHRRCALANVEYTIREWAHIPVRRTTFSLRDDPADLSKSQITRVMCEILKGIFHESLLPWCAFFIRKTTFARSRPWTYANECTNVSRK